MKTQNHYFRLTVDSRPCTNQDLYICISSVLPEDRVLQIISEHYPWNIRPAGHPRFVKVLFNKALSLEEAIIALRTSPEVTMYETQVKLVREEKKVPYQLKDLFTIRYDFREYSKVIIFTPKTNCITQTILNMLCKPNIRRQWLRHTLACLLDEKSDSHIKLYTDKKQIGHTGYHPIYESIEAYYILLSNEPTDPKFIVDNDDLVEIKVVSSHQEIKTEALPTNPNYVMYL